MRRNKSSSKFLSLRKGTIIKEYFTFYSSRFLYDVRFENTYRSRDKAYMQVKNDVKYYNTEYLNFLGGVMAFLHR